MITVITFYTPEYKDEATAWRRSCMDWLNPTIYPDNPHGYVQYPYKSYERDSKGSWVHNCTMKADVIQQAHKELNCGVVWTDADARFRSNPKEFDQLENYDFGCYWIPNVWNQPRNIALKPWSRGNEALNGSTLYFNNTEKSKKLLQDWKLESEANPTVWEQQSLQKVWEVNDNEGLKTYNFNQGYAKVFDAPWFEGEYPLVIEQMQASRKLKSKIR
jgi:Nucleotide-diphospho-sugar transferase